MASRATFRDERASPRDEVLFRTSATGPDGRAVSLVIVNISDAGFMARCDATFEAGELLAIDLPIVGRSPAEVRWCLGGRIGCRFADPIDDYPALLAALT